MTTDETRQVMENLFKEQNHMIPAGEQFSVESMEQYRKEAQAWLGDRSELSGRVMRNADWEEIWRYWRDLRH
ncbi:hypothetical protein ACFU7T_12070 [Streptomyces sp. NPDC057555]|uniref:hypothetical protein n=1 Tax=Streptomyces sp. NPDC057555 TaxID=3346166 RepID=UPI0036B80E61